MVKITDAQQSNKSLANWTPTKV